MKIFLQLIRLRHWVKNLIIFAPTIFALQLFNFNQFVKSFLAFIAFSFITVIVYIINDIKDKKNDSLHEIKKSRPIASGKINQAVAIIIGILFFIPGFVLSYFLGLSSFSIIIIYFVMNILYTFILKNFVILDVFIISNLEKNITIILEFWEYTHVILNLDTEI